MLGYIFFAIAAALLAGVGVKLVLEKIGSEHQITWREYGIGAAIIVIALAPLVSYIGYNVSVSNILTRHEYWNGWETATERQDIVCEEDGSCRYSYDCHPYIVYVSETCTRSDGNGGSESYECGHYETRYHQCPYVDVERNYIVYTTLGDYTIAAHRFPDNPQAHRWDESEEIPQSEIDDAGTGIPAFWAAAKRRIDSGWPGPVTERKSYDNYIIASDQTILKQHSSDIAAYQKQNLLPPVASTIHDFYLADKVHFVDYRPLDAQSWQDALARLNAALGAELQGDVQMVVVRSAVVSNDPDSYALALKAYWQDDKTFGKETFSKNGIGIVLGTEDGKTVAWARAFTGMPLGNEQMLVALESALKGHTLASALIIGSIRTTSKVVDDPQKNVSRVVVHSTRSGIIASTLWGDTDQSTRFARVGMTGHGTGHGSGFLYLKPEIQPTDGQKEGMAFIIFFLGCALWTTFAVASTRYDWRNSN